jgi:two-component system nitrate/nitrite response regulator NarL
MTTCSIRILLADDHRMFREALRRILEAEGGYEIVGEAGDGEELIRLAKQTLADVLLLDLNMPGVSGLEALRRLARIGIALRTIVLAGGVSQAEIVEALRLGARGVVLKDTSIDLLVKSIRHVMDGEYWIGHERIADVLQAVTGSPKRAPSCPADALTPREIQVVAAVMRGAANRQISLEFGVGEQTVKNHLSSIFAKLGVANRLELALFAVNHRLIPDVRKES